MKTNKNSVFLHHLTQIFLQKKGERLQYFISISIFFHVRDFVIQEKFSIYPVFVANDLLDGFSVSDFIFCFELCLL